MMDVKLGSGQKQACYKQGNLLLEACTGSKLPGKFILLHLVLRMSGFVPLPVIVQCEKKNIGSRGRAADLKVRLSFVTDIQVFLRGGGKSIIDSCLGG